MRSFLRLAIALLSLLGSTALLHASSTLPIRTDDLVKQSGAIFRGTVIRNDSFKAPDGLIYTRTSLVVDEKFKGKLPPAICVVHRGGEVGGENEYSGLSPQFANGGEYLLFVRRGANGRFQCTQGSASAILLTRTSPSSFESPGSELIASVKQLTSGGKTPGDDATDQAGDNTPEAASGMLNGIASRFVQPDRGEPIPYLIDVNALNLPTGMTVTQATNAVQQALNAWTAVTTLKFKLEGIQSFGQGADTLTNFTNQRLWIQLHDNYNSISVSNVLGVGGRLAQTSPVSPGWDLGGNIAGNEFRRTARGYVVLETTNSSMQNLATFTEVLTHEIGHALSLAHSSELTNEPNATLKQAIMYFQAHSDGRAATLGAYDIPIIQQVYPQFNTAPNTYDRVMDIVTQPDGAPNVPGINEVEVRGYDLQSTNLTMSVGIQDGGGTGAFSQLGNLFKFTPNDFWGTVRADPATGAYYDRIPVRFSDGTNASPYFYLRVISHNGDLFPQSGGIVTSDGLPDDWMTTYWGNPNPAAGPKRTASADFDNDGLSNLDEYRTGMDPTTTNSAQRLTITATNIQWQAKPYELYEILSSTNLATWTRFGNPVLPTNATPSISLTRTNSRQFFRVVKVP